MNISYFPRVKQLRLGALLIAVLFWTPLMIFISFRLLVKLILQLLTFLHIMICQRICVTCAGEVEELKKETVHRLNCALGLETENCPVDGGWTGWGSWGPCLGECGQAGAKTRSRDCDNPTPLNNGRPCGGPNFETKHCSIEGCTERDYEAIVKSDPQRTKELHFVKKIHRSFPCLVEKCLLAECQFTFVYKTLADLADRYWNALHCVKHDDGCPGSWSEWGHWSKCNSKCGSGRQIRCRSCDSPPPSGLDYNCTGDYCNYQICLGGNCEATKGKSWSEWGRWSSCSCSCGLGLMKRSRKCTRYATEESETDSPNCSGKDKMISKKLKRRAHSPIAKYCMGPFEEIKPCYIKNCPVDGGWSDWEPWSQCSVGCGTGVQYRSRACSNPPAMFGGIPCPGPITSISHCFHNPCPGKTHQVAVFSGDGFLSYSAMRRPTRLLHLFVRFRPSSLSGQLVRRRSESCTERSSCDEVKLFLDAGYLGFSARIADSSLYAVSENPLEMNVWHTALVMVTGSGLTMRIDDSEDHYKARFRPHVVLANMDHAMRVGKKFKGEIEQLAVNFKARQLRRGKPFQADAPNGLSPYSSTNVFYDSSEIKESFKDLGLLIHAPCPSDKNNWSIEIVVRPNAVEGYIMLMKGEALKNYMALSLNVNRVWLTVAAEDCSLEASTAQEINIEEWFNLHIDKSSSMDLGLSVNGGHRKTIRTNNTNCAIQCSELLIGNLKRLLQETGNVEDASGNSLPGVLGYLKIDDNVLDLESLPCTEVKHDMFSSQTISYSDNYEEVELLMGSEMNLTCFFDKNIIDEPFSFNEIGSKAVWLRFDTPIGSNNETSLGVKYDLYNNEHMTRLTASSYNSGQVIDGFYSCWIQKPDDSTGKVFYTFGVALVNARTEFSTSYTFLEGAIDGLIVSLVAALGFWFLVEAVLDWKQGYGIFRRQETDKTLKAYKLTAFLHSPQAKAFLEKTYKT